MLVKQSGEVRAYAGLSNKEEMVMLRILVPIDGSPNALRALRHAVKTLNNQGGAIHLLHVRAPYDGYGMVGAYLPPSRQQRDAMDAAKAALKPAEALLKRAGVCGSSRIVSGAVAGSIAAEVRRQRCNAIVMGSRGLGAIGSLVLGSVATEVIHLVKVPVTLVK
jgi:nucleotide-binding universal stress UspA family protein